MGLYRRNGLPDGRGLDLEGSRHALPPVLHRHRDPVRAHRWNHHEPDTPWMMQAARNLTDIDEGFLRGKPYLILDRDTKYSDAFRSLLVRDGIKIIRLRRMIFLGQAS